VAQTDALDAVKLDDKASPPREKKTLVGTEEHKAREHKDRKEVKGSKEHDEAKSKHAKHSGDIDANSPKHMEHMEHKDHKEHKEHKEHREHRHAESSKTHREAKDGKEHSEGKHRKEGSVRFESEAADVQSPPAEAKMRAHALHRRHRSETDQQARSVHDQIEGHYKLSKSRSVHNVDDVDDKQSGDKSNDKNENDTELGESEEWQKHLQLQLDKKIISMRVHMLALCAVSTPANHAYVRCRSSTKQKRKRIVFSPSPSPSLS
jgi:hypothetical protein